MDIYLIRHAVAVEREQFADHPDEERPLTDVGHAQAHSLATALPARGAKVLRLFVSPLVRTRQTAEPLIAEWGLTGDQVIEAPVLAPEGKASAARSPSSLTSTSRKQSALLGTDLTWNELAAWLIGDKKAANRTLDKGGVALVRVDGDELAKGVGELIWLLPHEFVVRFRQPPRRPRPPLPEAGLGSCRTKQATVKTRMAYRKSGQFKEPPNEEPPPVVLVWRAL